MYRTGCSVTPLFSNSTFYRGAWSAPQETVKAVQSKTKIKEPGVQAYPGAKAG